MSDLSKLSKDDLKDIGVLKMKHRIAIVNEVKASRDTCYSKSRDKKLSTEKKSAATSKCTGTITLSATGAASKRWPWLLGSYVATGKKHEGAAV